jgi:hypothetical protein
LPKNTATVIATHQGSDFRRLVNRCKVFYKRSIKEAATALELGKWRKLGKRGESGGKDSMPIDQ